MTGETVMPLPPDVRAAVGQLVADYRTVAKAISHTQVAENPPNGVPGWVGESADAYMGSIQKLGEHARGVPPVFASAVGVLEQWSDQVGVMITATVPELWEQYDQADREYRNALAEINHRMLENHSLGGSIPETEFATQRQQAAEVLRSTQDEVLAQYRKAMDQLDDEAQNAANALKGLQDSLVDPTKQDSRAAVGSTLFNDIPVLDGQAEWEYAQEQAPEIAKAMRDKDLTDEELRMFSEKYADYLKDPFFVNALMEVMKPEELVEFSLRIDMLPGSGDEEHRQRALEGIGTALVLSTGGENLSGDAAATQKSFETVREGLRTKSNEAIDELQAQQMEDLKAAGRTTYDTHDFDPKHGHTKIDGYDVMSQLMGSAASRNSELALGSGYFDDSSGLSVAQDLVAWDHETAGYDHHLGYAQGPTLRVPGQSMYNPVFRDAMHSMFMLMDRPESLDLMTGDETLVSADLKRTKAIQNFLACDTPFEVDVNRDGKIDQADVDDDHLRDDGAINMTRYLTGWRQSGAVGEAEYFGFQDGGETFGKIVAQSAMEQPEPQAWNYPSREEYIHAHSRWQNVHDVLQDGKGNDAARITGNLMVGYQEGLEWDHGVGLSGNHDLYYGQDKFGYNNQALRSWMGTILAPRMDNIADSLAEPKNQFNVIGGDFVFDADLKDRFLGKNGLFTDLAFDNPPRNDNGTPEFKGDDYYDGPGRRAPALLNMRLAAQQYYSQAMSHASSPGFIDAVNTRWAPAMDAIFTSNALADEQAEAAMDKVNQSWRDAISTGASLIPFSSVVDDKVANYIFDQSKSVVLPTVIDSAFPSADDSGANARLAEGHAHAEQYMKSATYTALSRVGTFPTEGENSPESFCQRIESEHRFTREGKIIDYSKMTLEQQGAFEKYITELGVPSSDGRIPPDERYLLNGRSLAELTDQLNSAATERSEAQDRINNYVGEWKPQVRR